MSAAGTKRKAPDAAKPAKAAKSSKPKIPSNPVPTALLAAQDEKRQKLLAKQCKELYVAAHVLGSAGLATIFLFFILACSTTMQGPLLLTLSTKLSTFHSHA